MGPVTFLVSAVPKAGCIPQWFLIGFVSANEPPRTTVTSTPEIEVLREFSYGFGDTREIVDVTGEEYTIAISSLGIDPTESITLLATSGVEYDFTIDSSTRVITHDTVGTVSLTRLDGDVGSRVEGHISPENPKGSSVSSGRLTVLGV